jgi:D-3-phosphoglycerate dehydrogenase
MFPKVVVTSPTFSRHEDLKLEIERFFPGCRFNTLNRRLEGAELAEFIADADAAVIGLEKIDGYILTHCDHLKIIAKFGVGLDNIDLDFCQTNDITVGWTGGVNRLSVAEMTLGFMISLSRNLFATSIALKNGVWNKQGGSQLSGKTVGIFGVGNIGKEVVRLLAPFDCRIIVNDIIKQNDYYASNGLIEVDSATLFAEADIVTIHTPLTNETKGLIDRQMISRMKPNALLINTARGGIIVHDDLRWALENNIIAGAAVDVYEVEPPDEQELISLPNLICTPHIGGNSSEAVSAMGMNAIKHLINYFSVKAV